MENQLRCVMFNREEFLIEHQLDADVLFLLEGLYQYGVRVLNLDGKTTKEDMEEKLLQAGYRTEETLLIAAEDATLQNGREIGLATIAFVNQKKNGQTYSAADIVVEGFGEVDFYFLERIYQRKHGIPWRVIETERTYLREMTVEDVDALYEIYAQEGMTDFIEPLCEKREDEIAYAEAHDIPLKISRETNYSKDKNLWHLSHEGLDLEKPSLEPQYNKPGFLELGVSPEQAPDTPSYVTIHFEKGIPTAVDGKEMDGVALIEYLNKIGGENGIGQLDIVENRLVGMKSRGVYETPAGTILYKAHNVLETITIDKDAFHFKESVAQKMGELVYDGKWFTPLREALSAFTDDLQKTVTGDVKLKLYKGNLINAGVTSPFTLYDEQTASFGEDEDYDQFDANGFINLFGLPIAERAKLAKNWPEVK